MLNSCQFIGNLGADPELRNFNSGGRVANLRLAVSEKWKDKNSGEQKEQTEWVNVAIFNEGLAGVAEKYLRKGSKVYVKGKLRTRKWQDNEGNDRYSTEVVLTGFECKMIMLDPPKQGGQQSQSNEGWGSQDSGTDNTADLGGDSIPF